MTEPETPQRWRKPSGPRETRWRPRRSATRTGGPDKALSSLKTDLLVSAVFCLSPEDQEAAEWRSTTYRYPWLIS